MKIHDLGRLDGPVVLWGGALGNLSALRALGAAARRVGGARVISTGGLAGYCAEGAACAAAVRRAGWAVVAGPVERRLAAPGGPGVPAAARWWGHAARTMPDALRDWFAGLPDMLLFTHQDRRYAVIHGGATDPARLLWPVSRQPEFGAEISAIEAAAGPVDTVIAGHCGLAFQRVVAARRWINAGAIGMPPNNGVPGGQYVRLTGGRAHILRLAYDPSPSLAAMRQAGLDGGYAQALRSGVWPRQEGLPEEMRRAAAGAR